MNDNHKIMWYLFDVLQMKVVSSDIKSNTLTFEDEVGKKYTYTDENLKLLFNEAKYLNKTYNVAIDTFSQSVLYWDYHNQLDTDIFKTSFNGKYPIIIYDITANSKQSHLRFECLKQMFNYTTSQTIIKGKDYKYLNNKYGQLNFE